MIQSAVAVKRMIVIPPARLQLRELELQDDEFILQLLNEAPFLRFIGDKGRAETCPTRANTS